MHAYETNRDDATAIGLNALVWVLTDDGRAARLLSLTGLTPDRLRAGAGEPETLAAVLRFLEAHEPDLVACAEGVGVEPARLVAARRSLES